MALQKYTKVSFFLGGALLMEAQSVTVSHKNNAQSVATIEKGFAGMSPGAATCELKCDSAAPRAGIEFDYLKSLANLEVLDVVLFRAGKKMKTKGFLTDVEEAYGVNQDAKVSCSMMCSPVEESTL